MFPAHLDSDTQSDIARRYGLACLRKQRQITPWLKRVFRARTLKNLYAKAEGSIAADFGIRVVVKVVKHVIGSGVRAGAEISGLRAAFQLDIVLEEDVTEFAAPAAILHGLSKHEAAGRTETRTDLAVSGTTRDIDLVIES